MMEWDIWVMDEECCLRCGTLLECCFETTLCSDCLHDAWYAEQEESWAAWFDNEKERKEKKS